MTDSLLTPRVPYCTILLVVSTLVCNAMVLLGNYWTADAMSDIGDSTKGWSKVGLGIASALTNELDEAMGNVSTMVLAGLEQVMGVQGEMDSILSLVGNTTDAAISNSPELSLLDLHGPTKGLMLLQEFHGKNASNVSSGLTTLIIQGLDTALDAVFDKISELLMTLFETLKPALEQIANWTVQFADTITAALEEFSTTIDKVQKMFDQATAQLSSSGANLDVMIENTFGLFDTDNSGVLTVQNLINVGQYYTVSALSGQKPYELMTLYDTDGSGEIELDEFAALVQDASITGSMGIILRNYAKRLAQIAGAVGQAKQRDEVASSVADYVRLVCAKNMTKVGWIADALTNSSLLDDFVGSVVVEMCLKNLDTNQPVYTDEDTGELLIGAMYDQNPDAVARMNDLLSNTTWFASQGFNTQYQPSCMKMLTEWSFAAFNSSGTINESNLLQLIDGVTLAEGVDHLKVIQAMPMIAFQLAEESVKLHKLEKTQARRAKKSQMFSSKTSKMLLQRLHQGAMASSVSGSDSDAASQAINAGIPASPTTLLFAKWLSYNASATAAGYISDCTDYSGESSNSADGFATKINGMVSKATSFIETFSTYASEEGIQTIETKIQSFITDAIADVKALVEERLNSLVAEFEPELEGYLHKAAYTAGEKIGTLIGSVLSAPITEALTEPLEAAVSQAMGSDQSELADKLAEVLGQEISNLTTQLIGQQAGGLLDKLIDEALKSGGASISSILSTAQTNQERMLKAKGMSLATMDVKRIQAKHELASLSSLDAEIDHLFEHHTRRSFKARKVALFQAKVDSGLTMDLSSAWTDVYNLMTSLYNLIPQAVSALKDARAEVSEVSSNLNSIFSNFETKGPEIFNGVAALWKKIWFIYFIFLLPFCGFTLYYGFWANGWFGGPQPISEADAAAAPPTDFSGRVKVLCDSCTHWCQGFHDTQTCFWSIIILMQVMVLLTFVISIVLCVIAGIEVMMKSGCSAVYVIEDSDSCQQGLEMIQSFLLTFKIGDSNSLTDATIGEACDQYSLLTCEMISSKLTKSATYVCVFSFLASILGLQLLFDASVLHEQAVFRRKAATLKLKGN